MTNRLRSLLHPGSGSSSRVRRVIRMMFISFSLGENVCDVLAALMASRATALLHVSLRLLACEDCQGDHLPRARQTKDQYRGTRRSDREAAVSEGDAGNAGVRLLIAVRA